MKLDKSVYVITHHEHPHEIIDARFFNPDVIQFDPKNPPEWVTRRLSTLRMLDFSENMASYPSIEGVGMRTGDNKFWVWAERGSEHG